MLVGVDLKIQKVFNLFGWQMLVVVIVSPSVKFEFKTSNFLSINSNQLNYPSV